MVRKKIFFSGRVQGVGFRYTAAWIARELGLTGWVRNLSDGRVEMEIQGEEWPIGNMLSRLQADTHIRVDDVEITELPIRTDEIMFQTKFTF